MPPEALSSSLLCIEPNVTTMGAVRSWKHCWNASSSSPRSCWSSVADGSWPCMILNRSVAEAIFRERVLINRGRWSWDRSQSCIDPLIRLALNVSNLKPSSGWNRSMDSTSPR